MTDRHNAYVVVLKEPIREDDAQDILTALRQIKGVISVSPVIGNLDAHIGQERAYHELRAKLIDVLYPGRQPS